MTCKKSRAIAPRAQASWLLTLVIAASCNAPLPGQPGRGQGEEEPIAEQADIKLVEVKQALTYDLNGHAYQAEFELLGHSILQKHAMDAQRFRTTMDTAFRGRVSAATAESLRGRILANDFSWNADVQIVPPSVLGPDRAGAYARSTGRIYMSSEVASSPVRLLIYLEEVGHHLEAFLGLDEDEGDEGELFARLVTGEILSAAEIAGLRQENDRGVISVDGQVLEVEFILGFFEDLWNGTKSAYNWTKGGLVSGGKFIWNGAKSAGEAIGKAAVATWEFGPKLGGWIKTGAGWYADTMAEVFKRDFWAGYQAVLSIKNVLVGTVFELGEGFKAMGDAIKLIGEGKILDGTAAFFVALVSTQLELAEDALITSVIDVIGVAQTILFLEPVGRFLTDVEKGFLRKVYADRAYFPFVRVKEGFAGLFTWLSARPFTSQFIIYLKEEPYSEALMVHEMAHVWQYVTGGTDYKSESFHAQAEAKFKQGDPNAAYVWKSDVDGGKGFGALNPEQQANIIDTAFSAGCFSFPLNPCFMGGDYTALFQDVARRLGVLPNNRPAEFVAAPMRTVDFGHDSQGWRVERHPRTLADINGDKKLDVVGFAEAGVYVSFATGNGFAPGRLISSSFGATSEGWLVERHPRLVTDMDGDRKADVIGFAEAGAVIAYSNGSTLDAPRLVVANFGAAPSAGGWTVIDHPRAVADVNGDGLKDIVGFGGAGTWVSLAQIGRTFAAPVFSSGFGRVDGWRADVYPRFVEDLNRDGRADVIGIGHYGVSTMLARPNGTFEPARFVLAAFGVDASAGAWGASTPRTLADVNNDGVPDIVGFALHAVHVALGNGDGTFAAPTAWLSQFGADPSAGGWAVDRHPRLVVDVTGDGRADIVGFGEAGIFVSRSGGSYFAPLETWSTEYGASTAGWEVSKHPRFIGDVTGDGRPDVVGMAYAGTFASFQVMK